MTDEGAAASSSAPVTRGPHGAGTPAQTPRRRGARIRRYGFTALAVLLGAAVAGAYAHFVGCKTGSCPITSSVWTASAYGGLVGLLIGWPGRGGTRDAG